MAISETNSVGNNRPHLRT